MPKTRHDEPSSNKAAMAIMVAGGLAVAALVVWALTRTVEPASGYVATTDATTTMTAPVTTPPAQATQPPTATAAAATTATSTAPPPPQPQGDRSEVTRIAVEDLRAKLNRNEVTVIDVRPANDFATRHIPGAINIPFASTEAMLDQIPRDKPIVTYCT